MKDCTPKDKQNNKDKKGKKNVSTQTANAGVSSNASNYNTLGYEVDPRTGNLQVTIAPPALSGFLGSNLTPAIKYSQQFTQNSMLGLPLGWSYGYSYVYASQVFVNGQAAYYIDSAYDSGLRYYELKNVVYKEYAKPLDFPYDKARKYTSTLVFYNGDVQYLDQYGRLIGVSDRFDNYVTVDYNRNGDVYSSRLSMLTDSYGQVISFSYASGTITITYPIGGRNKVSFSYLMDRDDYLVGYRDAIGRETRIVNQTGDTGTKLIHQIHNPNGLVVHYDYTTINYYPTADKRQFARLSCVSKVRQVSEGKTRVSTYNYNPDDNAHNYTGYPAYSTQPGRDNLLESFNNQYRYRTRVEDGTFMTEHVYNNLHLELESTIYTLDNLKDPISQVVNKYHGEDKDGYFPHYRDLPLNYQSPKQITTTVFNNKKEKISHRTETGYNDYGVPVEVRSYRTSKEKDFELVSKTITIYDYQGYGQLVQQDNYDYQGDKKVRRAVSQLTEDKKSVLSTTDGFLEAEGNFKTNKKSTYHYDKQGRLTKSELAWDNHKHHNLKNTHNQTSYHIEDNVLVITNTDAQGQASVTKTDLATGWIISQKDAMGSTVNYTYDDLGRTVEVVDPTGVKTMFVYDEKNNKITTLYANGYHTYDYYDGFGNEIKSSDNILTPERVLASWVYNDKNELVYEEGILGKNSGVNYYYDVRGEINKMVDYLGNVTETDRDPVSQTQTEYLNGIKENTTRQNNNVVIQTAYGKGKDIKSTWTYNNYSEIKKALLGEKNSSDHWIESVFDYDYELDDPTYTVSGWDGISKKSTSTKDLFGNSILDKVELLNHQAKEGDAYVYNNLSQLVEEKNNLGQVYQYTYNPAGLLETYTDYQGTEFIYTYYPDGSLDTVSHIDQHGKSHQTKHTYYYLTGDLEHIETFVEGESHGRMSYTYSLDGQITSTTYPDGRMVKYEYDQARGLLTKLTDATNQVTLYHYDAYGRLIHQEIEGTSHSLSITYYTKEQDAFNTGKVYSLSTSNGVERRYYYNGYQETERTEVKDMHAEESKNLLLETVYAYQELTRNITGITYRSTAFPENEQLNYKAEYAYNSLSQLVEEQALNSTEEVISTKRYTYDPAGNIVKEKTEIEGQLETKTYTYDEDNKLLSIADASGKQELTYDVSGNLVQDGKGGVFSYNARNKMTHYHNTETGLEAVYAYYPDGTRASKRVGQNETVHFYYDNATYPNVINEIQQKDKTSYLMLQGQRYVRLVHQADHTTTQYLVNNLKDNVADLSSQSHLKNSYAYDAYGKSVQGTETHFTLLQNPFLYNSEYADAESGLIYLRTRYYNPETRVFTTRDQAMLFNRYSFGDNNPIMLTDPSGQGPGLAILGIAGFNALSKLPWSSIGAIALGVGLVGVGIALTVLTVGAATPILVGATIVAGGLIGGGVASGIYGATHTNDFNAGDWGKTIGLGAAFGAASAGVSLGIGGLGASAASTFLLGAASNVGLGALDGYVTNGVLTGAWSGSDAAAAAGWGAAGGAIFGGIGGVLGWGRNLRNSKFLNSLTNRNSGALYIGNTRGVAFITHSSAGIKRGRQTPKIYTLEETETPTTRGVLLSRYKTNYTVYEDFDVSRTKKYGGTNKLGGIPDENIEGAQRVINNKVNREKNRLAYLPNYGCVQSTRDVLQGAGLEPPIWTRTATTLTFWFRRIGAIEITSLH